jgi:DNA-binding beta-propeller fold protein YncE
MLTSNNTPTLIATGITSSFNGITITPDGTTAYALGTDGTNGLIYIIDTASNTVTNTPITISGETSPSGITTDGTYLYVTGAGNQNLYIIPINNQTMISTVSAAGQPNCLTISSDASTVYIGYKDGDVNSYPVPSGSPAGTTVSLYGTIFGNSIATLPIPFTPPTPPTPSLLPPSSVSGCKTKNVFFLQTDYINNITWTAPTSGSPAAYAIYRDPMLTQLVAIVPASGPLQYYDHGRNPSVTYSYYIVSVDANGNQSTANSVTVTQNC